MKLQEVKCKFCKKKWVPRALNPVTGLPYTCPKCKNPRGMSWVKE